MMRGKMLGKSRGFFHKKKPERKFSKEREKWVYYIDNNIELQCDFSCQEINEEKLLACWDSIINWQMKRFSLRLLN